MLTLLLAVHVDYFKSYLHYSSTKTQLRRRGMENAVSWLFAGRKGMSWKFCQKSNFTNHPPSLQLFGIMQAVSFETVNDKHTVLTQTHDCSGEVCRGIAIVLNQIKINEMSENYTVFLYFYTHTLDLGFFPPTLYPAGCSLTAYIALWF